MLLLRMFPMQWLKLYLCNLRVSWVLAKSQGPCFSKKQIRIVKLNCSDTVIDDGDTQRGTVWHSTPFAVTERRYWKRNFGLVKIRVLSHVAMYSHSARAYLEAGGWYLLTCVKSGTVNRRGLRWEAGFMCCKATRTAAVLMAGSSDNALY